MRVRARKGAVIGAVGFAIVLSACGGGDGDGADEGESPGAGGASGAIVIENCKPQHPLVPANSNESCGLSPLQNVFSMLVSYNTETSAPELNVAESIESEDNINWTVKLKDGWTFHDGTPVTAQSFVDAWNWGAYGPNAAQNSYFYGQIGIEGAAEVAGEDQNGDGAVTEDEAPVKEMSGLAVVDDLTFTIKLSAPKGDLPTTLGYITFAPVPEVFFEDVEAFGAKPIGNGPFSVVEVNANSDVILTAYDGYGGEVKPKVKDVTFKNYLDKSAAYNDLLANNIDVSETLPPEALAGEQYKSDLGDRWIKYEVGGLTTMTFAPEDVDPAMADIELRRGIAQAIDRELIVQNIYQGTRAPADGWVAPVVDGYKEGQCGEWCTYDPDSAKQHMEASGFTGELTITYNADGAHKEWIEATCNSIRNATGVECLATPVVDFATYTTLQDNREMTGMFRSGWVMDYPSIENFLGPLYATGASSNYNEYSNPEFDAKLQEASAAADPAEGIALYQEAEAMLVDDLPAIPLWYYGDIAGYSTRVDNVIITPVATVDLLSITVTE